MEQEFREILRAQDAKLDTILKSVERTRRYLQVTIWITVIFFVLPLILLFFALPSFLSVYVGQLSVF